MPDALAHMTGLDTTALLDRIVPADEVFGAEWQAMFRQVEAAADDDERVALVEAFLLPRWLKARPASPLSSHRLADWSRSLKLHAATFGPWPQPAPGRAPHQAMDRPHPPQPAGPGPLDAVFPQHGGLQSGAVNWKLRHRRAEVATPTSPTCAAKRGASPASPPKSCAGGSPPRKACGPTGSGRSARG